MEREAVMPGGKYQLRGEAVRGANAWGWTSIRGFCSVHTKLCNKPLFLKVIGKNLFLATKSTNIPQKIGEQFHSGCGELDQVHVKAASRQWRHEPEARDWLWPGDAKLKPSSFA